jgi:hypothetical protein
MHLPQHQQMLSDARVRGTLDQVIEQIRRENPDAFHIETGPKETLSQRVFMGQPKNGEACRGFMEFYQAPAA